MSLKDTINNTNTQKDNLKTVATQIDNKLIALGGEQATDLFDVPNKIKKLNTNYKKIATGTITGVNDFELWDGIVNMNLDFVPRKVLFFIQTFGDSQSRTYMDSSVIDSKYNYSSGTAIKHGTEACWITNVSSKSFKVNKSYYFWRYSGKMSWMAVE